jgi:hypothetical protein
MKVVAFLEPPQADVIEKILRHCGLWHATRAPPAGEDLVHAPRGHSQADFDEPRELVFVAEDGIWAEAFPHDDWFRQQPDDGPQELTYVDEDTFWSEF